jgi:hypothetical protein
MFCGAKENSSQTEVAMVRPKDLLFLSPTVLSRKFIANSGK